ncbi:hypothetical protein EDF62_1557 [Leucobacter luti]|uniref:Uncharacterized protein n=1 Tax=Leucobacter luti TaxID=340320 RepID=A0A4R6RYX8_9MICO|nr:hypothetical protein EDF62_1557 [Leucobacter luti]
MADTLRADQLIEGNELLANISLVRDLMGMDFSTGVESR